MHSPRLLRYILTAFAVLAVLLVITVNRGLAGLVNDFLPGSALWVHLGLMAVEAVALLWFWRGLFGRRHYLLAKAGMTAEERREFSAELSRRLSASVNPRLAGLDPDSPGYLEAALFRLRKQADDEIRAAAQRVFLGTALSQNGRLDGLIVLISLCRLVWRISGIYNQRPHPREIMSLYWTVVSSTFLALSIEELNLTTEITVGFGESLQATAPAAATSSMPFVGAALQTFTASAIDGAANCFLTLRAGIIARNAYAYNPEHLERPGRAAVFREAGAMLLGMSGSMMERLAKSLSGCLGGKLAGLGRYAQNVTVQAGKTMADGVSTVGDSAVEAVLATGRATGKAGGTAMRAAGKVAGGVGRTAAVTILATGKATGRVTGLVGRRVIAPFRRKD